LIVDVSSDNNPISRNDYLSVISKSIFVLCPRGYGSSSYRLFEALKMGRIPVIISDAWVPPQGPDWSRCSIRIAEANVSNIPEILEDFRPRAVEMMENVKSTWADWFAEDVVFHQITEWCLELKRDRIIPERLARYYFWGGRIIRRVFNKNMPFYALRRR
jgi:hypothetical protein